MANETPLHTGEHPARLPYPPPSIVLLLPEPGWVSPAHGSRGDTATPRRRNGWVLPSHLPMHPPCASPRHEAPRTAPPEAGGTCPPGVSEPSVPCLPPPRRVGLPAAKCPLSIRRQARDYRGRLFEAETNRKSFSQLPFGDINTAGRGSAGSAVPGGAVGCWDASTRTRSHGHTHTLAHTDTRSHPGQHRLRGTHFPVPAGETRRGRGVSVSVSAGASVSANASARRWAGALRQGWG